MIGEVYKIDTETSVKTIPPEEDLRKLLPSAHELFPHISGRAMTREQLLGRVTCFYKGFVEPANISEHHLAHTIWEISSASDQPS